MDLVYQEFARENPGDALIEENVRAEIRESLVCYVPQPIWHVLFNRTQEYIVDVYDLSLSVF